MVRVVRGGQEVKISKRLVGAVHGKIAMVTGASSGIGFTVAKKLGKAGARVILVARGLEALGEEGVRGRGREDVGHAPAVGQDLDGSGETRDVEGRERPRCGRRPLGRGGEPREGEKERGAARTARHGGGEESHGGWSGDCTRVRPAPWPGRVASAYMKALFVVGLVLLILGVASLFVPIPKKDRAGVEIGGVRPDPIMKWAHK